MQLLVDSNGDEHHQVEHHRQHHCHNNHREEHGVDGCGVLTVGCVSRLTDQPGVVVLRPVHVAREELSHLFQTLSGEVGHQV